MESFKSTLDETREADVLLHVVDATHERFEDHIHVVRETLEELGVTDKPTLLVFNKVDALEERGLLGALRETYGDGAVFVSALRGIGLEALRERALALVESDYSERTVLVPVTEAKALAHLHRTAEILGESVGLAESDATADVPVMRVHYRASPKNAPELDRMLLHYAGLRWRGEMGEASGDGAPESARLGDVTE